MFRLTRDVNINGTLHKAGDVVDAKSDAVESLLQNGWAVKEAPKQQPSPKRSQSKNRSAE